MEQDMCKIYKNYAPQMSSNFTMQKEVANIFRVLFTHMVPSTKLNFPLLKIGTSETSLSSIIQEKHEIFKGSLLRQIFSQGQKNLLLLNVSFLEASDRRETFGMPLLNGGGRIYIKRVQCD